jgi:hypothetical protein
MLNPLIRADLSDVAYVFTGLESTRSEQATLSSTVERQQRQTVKVAGSTHAYRRAVGDPFSRLGTPPGGRTGRRPVQVPPFAL